MRIACVHVPQFALQSLGRIDPSLRGAAVAVVGAGLEPAAGAPASLALHSPIVLACSRAAWAAGVRLGMTATAARFVSPDVRVVAADGAQEREAVRAIADALLGLSAVVDTGGRVGASGAHLAMYCELPGPRNGKLRGATFGARVLDVLDSLGLAGRVGIADDRFTAWVAASHSTEGGAREDRGVVSVPRGGSAAFLAPRPLSLLAITPEVQHMLEALGVRTLGEFAALPAPSVSRPLEADYQALARGDSGSALRPYAPDAPIREELVVRHDGSLFGGAAAVGTLAERIALRLAGRGRGASRLELMILGEHGERVVPLTADAATSADALAELVAPHIAEAPGAVSRLRIVVVGEAIAEVAAVASGASAALPAGALAAAAIAGAAGAAGDGMTDGTADGMTGGTTEGTIDALSAALSAAAGRRARSPGQPGQPEEIDALVGPDSLPWQLSAPTTLRAERRDAHRRTRRAKQRRRTVTLAQPPLFGQLDG
jgi:impB/mucB/samB family